MKVISIISSKGGSAKTLLTTHLACEAQRQGLKTLAIDVDAQCSLSMWADAREAATPLVESIQAQRLEKTLGTARDAGVELVFVDTPGCLSAASYEAAKFADLVLIPCRPLLVDLRAIRDTATLVQQIDRPAHVIFTTMPHGARKIEREVKRAVSVYDLKACPVIIHQWSALANAFSSSMGITEIEPDSKAAKEITDLCTWVGNQLVEASSVTQRDRSVSPYSLSL